MTKSTKILMNFKTTLIKATCDVVPFKSNRRYIGSTAGCQWKDLLDPQEWQNFLQTAKNCLTRWRRCKAWNTIDNCMWTKQFRLLSAVNRDTIFLLFLLFLKPEVDPNTPKRTLFASLTKISKAWRNSCDWIDSIQVVEQYFDLCSLLSF